MKRYRIISNDEKYRVQKHVRFGPINYWKTEKFYEVTETYPKVVAHKVEFDYLAAAEDYVRKQLKEEKPLKRMWPFAVPKGWKVVEKFSDSQAGEPLPLGEEVRH
ncbi:MAG: hypothetical protein Q7Q71_06840 [Verrucomicrobiota bacterium JB023]|nr:hypothetical protein [Verrucomicrobiota bacterium JB023]